MGLFALYPPSITVFQKKWSGVRPFSPHAPKHAPLFLVYRT